MDNVVPLRRTATGAPTPPSGHAPRCVVFREGILVDTPTDLGQISEILKEDDTFIWFDVVDPGPNDLALIQEEFTLHPLAIEDAIHAHQRPKIESYRTYWFLVIQGVTRDAASDRVQDAANAGLDLQFHEVAIFAGERFLVTVRHAPPYPLDEIERRWLTRPPAMRRDSGFLLYTILDTIVDGYFAVTEQCAELVNAIEASLLGDAPRRQQILLQMFALKREVQRFRHAALPMREILTPIIRGDLPLFTPEEVVYYRDIYDHTIQVINQLDAARDLVNGALDIHLSLTANRQNEIAQQLTLIATIFLPLTFITGFFGQNFGFLVSHIEGARVFWILGIGSEIVVLAALFIYFKHKRWY
jgi:magnesium transporter